MLEIRNLFVHFLFTPACAPKHGVNDYVVRLRFLKIQSPLQRILRPTNLDLTRQEGIRGRQYVEVVHIGSRLHVRANLHYSVTCLTLYDIFLRAGHALISLSGGHARFGANAASRRRAGHWKHTRGV